MPISISDSVGVGGRNKPTDVALVQQLLNNANSNESISADGLTGNITNEAIKAFQKNRLNFINPDSLIDPGGKTFEKLKSYYKASPDHSTLGIRSDRFSLLYQKQYSMLSAASETGLSKLINFILNDQDITDLRWAAYMLATTKHETADTLLPIEEYGKGVNKPYGVEITVTDENGLTHINKYYGRGYVQLTWDYNYKTISEKLNMGEELYIHPDQALDENTAYNIMSYGMRHGSFTSHSLSKYISGVLCDYVNARRIINGTDKAQLIADYASEIELLLRLSRS